MEGNMPKHLQNTGKANNMKLDIKNIQVYDIDVHINMILFHHKRSNSLFHIDLVFETL